MNRKRNRWIAWLLLLVIAALSLSGCGFLYGEREYTPPEIVRTLDFEVEDGEEPLKLETYYASELGGVRKTVYELQYLEEILGWKPVDAETVKKTMYANPDIPEKFRDFIAEFIDRVAAKHPDADLRVFNENLKTLKITECTKNELMHASLSVDSYGCYVQTENCIYVLDGPLPEEGTWDFQVMYHELCHAMRLYNRSVDDDRYKVSVGLDCRLMTCDEALNSLFAVSLFNYEETDIAYQLQSNCYGVIVDCMEGYYDISDYINHSQSYFAKKLDEYNGNTNYAYTIFKLIEEEYNDYHSDNIERDFSLYKPIYEYIARMYYGKYLTDDMTDDEKTVLADRLKDRILFDVPEEYAIDPEIFYEYLDAT